MNIASFAYRNGYQINELLAEWGFERLYKYDLSNEEVNITNQEDIEYKVSDWVVKKTDFGLSGEEKAFNFLFKRYKSVTKVEDYFGFDFLCENTTKDYYEVKTVFEDNFKIHLSINQLESMMEYIDNYYILIVSVFSDGSVKYYQIPSFLLALDININWFNEKFENDNCSFKSTNYEINIVKDVVLLYEETF